MDGSIGLAGGREDDLHTLDDLDAILSSSTPLESLFSEFSPRSQNTRLSASPRETSASNVATSWKSSPTLSSDVGKEWSDWDEWGGWVEYDWGNHGMPAYSNDFSFPTSDVDLTTSAFDFSCPLPDTLLSEPSLFPTLSTAFDNTQRFSVDLASLLGGESHTGTGISTSSLLQSIAEEPHLLGQAPSSGDHLAPLEPELSLPLTDYQEPRTSPPAPSKKRKSASLDPDDQKPNREQNRKKTHNFVEKRYRNKLNDSIAALRDCIPSLQQPDKDIAGHDDEGWDSHKSVTKGVVLSRATQYIQELDARNKRLSEENMLMRKQLVALRKLSTNVTQANGTRMHSSGGSLSKLMVGGLAGMLAFQGFGTTEQSNESPSGRGLFALPAHISNSLRESFHHLAVFSGVSGGDSIIVLLKVLLIFAAAVYVIWPSYFDAIPRKTPLPKAAQSSAAVLTSDTSPQDLRRRAFLTSIQTIWMPKQRLELFAAIALQLARLGARCCGIDWPTLARPGDTPSGQEALAIKAWDIALDAQLTGGDSERSVGRLLLTLLAAMSLPETPYRLMLRAVHSRVLSRSAADSWPRILRGYLDRLAKKQWERARTQQTQATKQSGRQEDLPENLAKLLELDAEKIFLDEVVERAYDMAWDKPSANTVSDSMDWMCAITEDSAIRSPLDAFAAWRSALAFRNVLRDFLEANTEKGTTEVTGIQKDLDLALRIAPPRSTIWVRELVMRAILLDVGRRMHIASAFQALLISTSQPIPVNISKYTQRGFLKTKQPFIPADLALPLRSAIAISLLRSPDEQKALSALAKQIEASGKDIGLLGFVALYRFLDIAFRDKEVVTRDRELAEKIAGLLRLWIGGDKAKANGLGKMAEKKVASLCVEVFEWLVGIQVKGEERE